MHYLRSCRRWKSVFNTSVFWMFLILHDIQGAEELKVQSYLIAIWLVPAIYCNCIPILSPSILWRRPNWRHKHQGISVNENLRACFSSGNFSPVAVQLETNFPWLGWNLRFIGRLLRKFIDTLMQVYFTIKRMYLHWGWFAIHCRFWGLDSSKTALLAKLHRKWRQL